MNATAPTSWSGLGMGLLCLAVSVWGCSNNPTCNVDGDCAVDQRCAAGVCGCANNNACDDGEFCNAKASCQIRSGCRDNGDCGADQFCDVKNERCTPTNVCGSDATCCADDAHCAFGEVCDGLLQRCIAGCRDNGDCPLGRACDGNSLGALGQCGTRCSSDAGCAPGELCSLADGVCEKDNRGPYCLGCAGGIASDDCGAPGNYCLLDTVSSVDYCGVDCWLGEACPAAYTCRDVIILPRSTLPLCTPPESCTGDRCTLSGDPCTVNEDCPLGPPGSDCPRAEVGNCEVDPLVSCSSDADCATGRCLKQECRVREGAIDGVCTCTRDTDCPVDRCLGNPQAPGVCELSGHRCFVDGDCPIACIEGGCRIGKNCKPANDRTCGDLQPATPAAQ